ncbi:sigma factor-like helix-turn-helix DNA-binding protein [Halomicrobium katesii]|uniref:sigma factor-like helix-turn-helix DNA-binding protein n=1 Tax=Halomicrobium katesii TaxID=437163 RepID=UPI000377F32F|nr:sigma factor-like helix-turn-helix DNA-binding protein [Halomicrobium katesii]
MRYQSDLFEYEEDLSPLTDAQREVYEAVEQDGYGVREYARKTGRSKGTVGNLLRRARRRLGGDEA